MATVTGFLMSAGGVVLFVKVSHMTAGSGTRCCACTISIHNYC